jgi:hypothetical protein
MFTISLFTISLFFTCLQVNVLGNLRTAYEQVVGQWNINLHMMQSQTFYDTLVFTPSSFDRLHSSSNLKLESHDIKKRPQRRFPPNTHVLACSLDLHPNGTFSLLPKTDLDVNPVHGYWTIQPNPYCVTDRQYDELYMVSLPRVQVRDEDRMSTGRSSTVALPVQAHAILELRSRVWGRFSSRSIQNVGMRIFGHGRNIHVPRMTHGTCSLLLERVEDPKLRNKHGQGDIVSKYFMVGSFQGRATVLDSMIKERNRADDDDDYYNYYIH